MLIVAVRRAIKLCTRQFRLGSPLDGAVGELVIIHELLHALGLGENPPTSHEIVALVWRRCGAVLTRPPTPSPASGSSERAPVFEPVDGIRFSVDRVLIRPHLSKRGAHPVEAGRQQNGQMPSSKRSTS